jgi:hypothetical protein
MFLLLFIKYPFCTTVSLPSFWGWCHMCVGPLYVVPQGTETLLELFEVLFPGFQTGSFLASKTSDFLLPSSVSQLKSSRELFIPDIVCLISRIATWFFFSVSISMEISYLFIRCMHTFAYIFNHMADLQSLSDHFNSGSSWDSSLQLSVFLSMACIFLFL